MLVLISVVKVNYDSLGFALNGGKRQNNEDVSKVPQGTLQMCHSRVTKVPLNVAKVPLSRYKSAVWSSSLSLSL